MASAKMKPSWPPARNVPSSPVTGGSSQHALVHLSVSGCRNQGNFKALDLKMNSIHMLKILNETEYIFTAPEDQGFGTLGRTSGRAIKKQKMLRCSKIVQEKLTSHLPEVGWRS